MKVSAKSAGIGLLVGGIVSVWAVWYNYWDAPQPAKEQICVSGVCAPDGNFTPEQRALISAEWLAANHPSLATTTTTTTNATTTGFASELGTTPAERERIRRAIENGESLTLTGVQWEVTKPDGWIVGVGGKIIDAATPYDRRATNKARAAVTQATWSEFAEVSTSSMAPAFPHRKGIAWTINADLAKRRFNLALMPNVHEGPHRCDGEWMAGVPPHQWGDAGFRMAQGIDQNGNFPVRIQRDRGGVIDTIATVWIPAGPQPSWTQISLRGVDWQMWDKVRIPLDSELLFVACDPYTGAVIEPRLSGVEQLSGDSTPIPGKVVRW